MDSNYIHKVNFKNYLNYVGITGVKRYVGMSSITCRNKHYRIQIHHMHVGICI